MKPCRSDTYLRFPPPTNRGLFSPIRAAESGYQGSSRGREPGVDSSASNVVFAKYVYYYINNKS
jgi:hypothetical protein